MTLIRDVHLGELETHSDERGSLTEVFRQEWVSQQYVQWNSVWSSTNVLRGVHGHFRHADNLILLQGSAWIGLRDLRPDSPTLGLTDLIHLQDSRLQCVIIPPGVAHGFYFPEPSLMIYAVTHYWQTDDEFGCRWDDPELGIAWPCDSPSISERDAGLPQLSVFTEELQQKLARPGIAIHDPMRRR